MPGDTIIYAMLFALSMGLVGLQVVDVWLVPAEGNAAGGIWMVENSFNTQHEAAATGSSATIHQRHCRRLN